MRMLKILGGAGAIAAALALAPSLLEAANTGSPVNRLLSQLRDNANRTCNDAGKLVAYKNNLDISWDLHLASWNYLKSDVNAMGALILRLNDARDGAAPLQQKQIDQALSLIQTMARETNNAIEFLDANHKGNFDINPAYLDDINVVADKSQQLARSLGDYFQFAKVRGKELRLRKDLGISTD